MDVVDSRLARACARIDTLQRRHARLKGVCDQQSRIIDQYVSSQDTRLIEARDEVKRLRTGIKRLRDGALDRDEYGLTDDLDALLSDQRTSPSQQPQ